MTYYKTILTLKNGRHKILRLMRAEVAHVVSEVRKFRTALFRDDERELTICGVTFTLCEIISWKFINEYTREELLTI